MKYQENNDKKYLDEPFIYVILKNAILDKGKAIALTANKKRVFTHIEDFSKKVNEIEDTTSTSEEVDDYSKKLKKFIKLINLSNLEEAIYWEKNIDGTKQKILAQKYSKTEKTIKAILDRVELKIKIFVRDNPNLKKRFLDS